MVIEECPCRFCTPDTGRSGDCHGRCHDRYIPWKKRHDERVALERQQRNLRRSNLTGQWYRQNGYWRNKNLIKERK